jgi:hypothetical protein
MEAEFVTALSLIKLKVPEFLHWIKAWNSRHPLRNGKIISILCEDSWSFEKITMTK